MRVMKICRYKGANIEIEQVTKIVNKAMRKIPYEEIDIRITINDSEWTFYDKKKRSYGFKTNEKGEMNNDK